MFDIILTNKLFKLHNLFLKKNGHYHSSVLCCYLFFSSIFSSFKVFCSFLLFAAGRAPFQQTKTTPDNGHFKHRQYTHKTKKKQTSNLNNKREDIRGKFCWHKPYASVTRCFFFVVVKDKVKPYIYLQKTRLPSPSNCFSVAFRRTNTGKNNLKNIPGCKPLGKKKGIWNNF